MRFLLLMNPAQKLKLELRRLTRKRHRRETLENLAITGLSIGAGIAVKKGLETAWEQKKGLPAPNSPKLKDPAPWKELAIWSAVSGALVVLTQTAVARGADDVRQRRRRRR